ncbi:hypothetical protein B0I72DRAFT_42337 [Yarrowia lipolytica]|jgi:hypothetical protein|uniref:YALI0E32395p n=2 Tax=Yarrowia lipolytica TaxID=4952 RepID=Q6C3S9_YARLI|nr:YALI0E32395p [Yarrowia lipolytica CLIB122]AOW06290.1 hypothetical protein YALI1_E38349g [Yarrowia lipolytica]KAB8285453.1 hypothetical protein BKA91DRAFT_34599 [Yarrowia lipolytica]KAE8175458.1 hypothetical protein BKA90DRAFT_1432 [Yarrowia lipolytica]KAJ8057662.1 hypothetical protein LXG23DRAFT_54359 [Yarrowia lipolytica]RDW24676.1 hypothetical protein B0I71DRAFT_47474 [Yarrowia lipolytica]|eukprot:XP_504683.1 YALI0E32395p [Yarrowia lipolytica CLIB122]
MSAEKHDATSSEDETELELAPIKSPVSPAPKSLRSPRSSLLPVVNSNPNERTQTQTPPLIQGPGFNPATQATVVQSSTPTARTRALSSFSQSSDESSGLAPPSTGRKRISMSFTLPVAPSPDVIGPGDSPPTRPQHLDTYTGANHSPTPSGSGLRTLSASRTTSTKSPPPQQPQVTQVAVAEDRPERGRSRNAGSGGPGSEVMEYLSQLATKESRVSKLREKLLEVKRELESAEADLKQFKTKDVLMLHMPHREGQQPQGTQESSLLDSIQTKLMSLAVEEEQEEEESKTKKDVKEDSGTVTGTQKQQHSRRDSNGTLKAHRTFKADTNNHDSEIETMKRDKRASHQDQRPALSHSSSSSVSSTQSSGTHVPMERRRASISAPGLPPRDDVMSMGKRVIGEIGSQFYGLVADIRSATFGDDLAYQNPSLNYGGNNNMHHTGGGQVVNARRVSGAQLRGEASSSPSSRRRNGRDVVDSYSYI